MYIAEVDLEIMLEPHYPFLILVEEYIETIEHHDFVWQYCSPTMDEFSLDSENDRFSFLDVDI